MLTLGLGVIRETDDQQHRSDRGDQPAEQPALYVSRDLQNETRNPNCQTGVVVAFDHRPPPLPTASVYGPSIDARCPHARDNHEKAGMGCWLAAFLPRLAAGEILYFEGVGHQNLARK